MVGDPFEDVLYGPMINQRFADRFEEWLGLVEDHHEVSGSTATGRITADNPREGFVGDPADGLYFHPTIVAGVTADDAIYSTETFGPHRRRRPLRRLRRGGRAGQRPRLRAVGRHLHQRRRPRAAGSASA